MMQQIISPMVAPTPKSSSSLKTSVIVLGAISLFLWANATGFSLGFGFISYSGLAGIGTIFLILLNAAYMICTCHIIYAITAADFPSPGLLRKVRQNVSRLTAATILGFSLMVTSIVWFCTYSFYHGWQEYQAYACLLGCSMGYVFAIIVASLAGIYEAKISKQLSQSTSHPTSLHSAIPLTSYMSVSPNAAVMNQMSGGHVNPVMIPMQQLPGGYVNPVAASLQQVPDGHVNPVAASLQQVPDGRVNPVGAPLNPQVSSGTQESSPASDKNTVL